MLSGEDIVCLALRTWDSTWKNNQKVMSLLARWNRVLYVDPPRPFRDSLRPMGAGNSHRQTVERVAESLFVYSEPWYLRRFNPFRLGSYELNWILQQFRFADVRRVCRQLGFVSPILWVYDPMLASAVGSFGEKLVVYQVIDNYDEFFPSHATRYRYSIVRKQRIMLDRADIVFAVSEGLRRRCLEFNPNSHLVPNGVNYALFEEAMRSDRLPSDVEAIPRPIVGYVGTMRPQVDFRLMDELAARRPDWSFVMVGPVEDLEEGREFRALRERRNVYYLGPKPVTQVPFYMKACDVALLPYRIDESALYGDSQKVYEYLASGRPVVSSDMPAARQFTPLVRIAGAPSQFIDEIELGIAEDGARSAERMALAKEHSWDQRVGVMRDLVSATLAVAARKDSASH